MKSSKILAGMLIVVMGSSSYVAGRAVREKREAEEQTRIVYENSARELRDLENKVKDLNKELNLRNRENSQNGDYVVPEEELDGCAILTPYFVVKDDLNGDWNYKT